MSKTGTVLIGLITALVLLAGPAPAPVYARAVDLQLLVLAREQGTINVGDHVVLRVTVDGSETLPASWAPQIQCRGRGDWKVIPTCPAGARGPCVRGVFLNAPGNWTCRAVAYWGSARRP
jgi:hypothetical protein